ncbi:hypothetical protein TNCV_280001 [Trichonephila clavipes]|nr:hypothetical protein TNCV_280001 [Trichonephila clavipes]
MMLKAMAMDRRKNLAPCRYEFHGPLSDVTVDQPNSKKFLSVGLGNREKTLVSIRFQLRYLISSPTQSERIGAKWLLLQITCGGRGLFTLSLEKSRQRMMMTCFRLDKERHKDAVE